MYENKAEIQHFLSIGKSSFLREENSFQSEKETFSELLPEGRTPYIAQPTLPLCIFKPRLKNQSLQDFTSPLAPASSVLPRAPSSSRDHVKSSQIKDQPLQLPFALQECQHIETPQHKLLKRQDCFKK